MTAFEITIITLLALIAFALIFRDFVIGKALDQIIHNQDEMYKRQNIIKDDLMRVRERVMHLTIIDDKLDKIVFPTTQSPPCYAPDGVCMNPHGDCINCPKRGTDGTWSTSTNLNKED